MYVNSDGVEMFVPDGAEEEASTDRNRQTAQPGTQQGRFYGNTFQGNTNNGPHNYGTDPFAVLNNSQFSGSGSTGYGYGSGSGSTL